MKPFLHSKCYIDPLFYLRAQFKFFAQKPNLNCRATRSPQIEFKVNLDKLDAFRKEGERDHFLALTHKVLQVPTTLL